MRWQTASKSEYDLLKANARENRNHMTDAERIFWEVAKQSKLGQKCRRQYIIGTYIVDFIFLDSKLIIEIDGGYHLDEQQHKNDELRQQSLELLGYKVIRFKNEQVLSDIDSIINKVKSNLIN